MQEIIIKIKFDDDAYTGHGGDVPELIMNGIETFMKIDMEGDGVVKRGWSVELVS